MTEVHIHNFNTIKLINVIADGPSVRRPIYKGEVAMGILARVCACGKDESFEYGKRRDMKILMGELNLQRSRNEHNK